MSLFRCKGVSAGTACPKSTLALRLGGRLDLGAVGSTAISELWLSIENMFWLEAVRESGTSRGLSFLPANTPPGAKDIGIVLLIFIIQNLDKVRTNLLFWHFELPLGVTVLLSVIAGALVMGLVGGVRILQLRHAAKRS